MALYGLSVFLETPKPQREGRGMYIFISLLITTLAVVGASLDSYHIFKVLMEATSTMSFMEMSKKYVKSWERVTSVFCSIIIIFIGDTLLVCLSPCRVSLRPLPQILTFVSGLPMLRHLEASLVCRRSPSSYLHRVCRYVVPFSASTHLCNLPLLQAWVWSALTFPHTSAFETPLQTRMRQHGSSSTYRRLLW